MRLFYKPEYAVGRGGAGGAASLGYVCFSLFNIAGTIINGAGRTLPTIVIGVVTLARRRGRQLDRHRVGARRTAAMRCSARRWRPRRRWRSGSRALGRLSAARASARSCRSLTRRARGARGGGGARRRAFWPSHGVLRRQAGHAGLVARRRRRLPGRAPSPAASCGPRELDARFAGAKRSKLAAVARTS